MNKIIQFLLCCCFFVLVKNGRAQLNIGGQPYSFENKIRLEKATTTIMPALNLARMKAEDEADKLDGVPPRFGYKHSTDLNLRHSGKWTTLENGDRIWTLAIFCPDAKSINLLYDVFWLPKGATLYIYNRDKSHLIGGFTERNNNAPKGSPKPYATGLVFGDYITLEYYEPKAVAGEGEIAISRVVHGYRYIDIADPLVNSLDDSGDCQVNVNCSPEGDDWQSEKNSVALTLVDGNRWCTGSLMMNTSHELVPYFLTAHHCLAGWAIETDLDAVDNPDASDWSFVWNYESPDCDDPDSDDDINFFTSVGAIVAANNEDTDFALLRLTEDPLEVVTSGLAYNSWNASGIPESGGVGIHHPSGDIKKIATHSMTPISTEFGDFDDGTFWRVSWDQTDNGHSVAEGGSSGSPLYDNDGRVIGQLYGGYSDCSDPNTADAFYGKFSVSWHGNNNSNLRRRLSRWLHPACHENINWGDWTGINNESPIIQASGYIRSASTILGTGFAYMVAGDYIVLEPGFRTNPGADLAAKIGGCGSESLGASNRNNIQTGTYVLPEDVGFDALVDVGTSSNSFTEQITQELKLNISPNPVSSTTNIDFFLPNPGLVNIEVFDLNGRLVKTVSGGEIQESGAHRVRLDGRDLQPGLYLCRITTAKEYRTVKFVVK